MILYLNSQNLKTTSQSYYMNITKRLQTHLEFLKARDSTLKYQNQQRE